jgi:hypothetical protein
VEALEAFTTELWVKTSESVERVAREGRCTAAAVSAPVTTPDQQGA